MESEFSTYDYPNSNRALYEAFSSWVPDYSNPYNLILTFANDVSEEHARQKYSALIRKISKRILNRGYKDWGNLIAQHGYLEFNKNGRFHIHSLCDVREDWDEKFTALVRKLWRHGIDVQITKVPKSELVKVHQYNSKMRTKKTESGYYSDSFLIVDKPL